MDKDLLRVVELGRYAFTALDTEDYYACYISMAQRTTALYAILQDKVYALDELVVVQEQTIDLERCLSERSKKIQDALAKEVQLAKAKISYAKNSFSNFAV